jgi:hypothetical protein
MGNDSQFFDPLHAFSFSSEEIISFLTGKIIFLRGNYRFPDRKIYFLLRKCTVSLQEKLFSSEEVLSFLTGKFIFLRGNYRFPDRKNYFPQRKFADPREETGGV